MPDWNLGFSVSIMGSSITYGPYMRNTAPNGSYTLSTVRSWTKLEVTSTVRRPKPEGINLLLEMTPFYHQSYFVQRAYERSPGGSYPSTYQAQPEIGTMSVVPDDLGRRAWAQALERLQNGKFDSATFLGELPETIRWIAGVAKEMMDAYLALKRGRWIEYLPRRNVQSNRKGRRRLRVRGPRYRVFTFTRRDGSQYNARLALDGSLAKRYLEWRFAVQPLVSEVGNLLDAYYEQALNPMISVVRGSVSTTEPLVGHFQKGSRRVRVKALGYYTITTSAKALQKWGGVNLVHTLWNLVPLSFMIDRFIPIGEFLGNLDAEFGVTWKSVSTSVVYNFELVTDPPINGFSRHEVSSAYGKGNVRELKKFANTLPSNVTFDRFNFQTGLDLLALTRSIGESLLKK